MKKKKATMKSSGGRQFPWLISQGKRPSKLPLLWVFIPIRFIAGGPNPVNYQKSNFRSWMVLMTYFILNWI